jgi:tRNA pseudouridine55 synthase
LITDGFLAVDKSAGMTSHDAVAIARRALGTKKVGHAGTLDPMATGVLVLGFGNGTRLLQYITEGEKEYVATIVLGASTVTDDAEGVLLFEAPAEKVTAITDEQIKSELQKMVGHILQRPSSVSAVKVAGERAHARVRAGESFELPVREVHISSLVVREIRRLEHSIEVDIDVICGAGTFIRAIARDCGQALQVGRHLNALRRTQVASFKLESAISVDSLKSGEFIPLHIGEVASKTFPIRELNADETRELSFGRVIPPNFTDLITAAVEGDRLIALLSNEENHARPIAVFTPRS